MFVKLTLIDDVMNEDDLPKDKSISMNSNSISLYYRGEFVRDDGESVPCTIVVLTGSLNRGAPLYVQESIPAIDAVLRCNDYGFI